MDKNWEKTTPKLQLWSLVLNCQYLSNESERRHSNELMTESRGSKLNNV